MKRIDLLKKQQALLKEDISSLLDRFLIGTIAKSPAMSGFGLTTKVDGKTVSLYVRKDLAAKAKDMSKRYDMLWILVQKLSKVNWELLKLENE